MQSKGETLMNSQSATTEIIISDGTHGHREHIPIDILDDSAMLRNWMEEWMTGYVALTDDPDILTENVSINVINTATDQIKYIDDFVVSAYLV